MTPAGFPHSDIHGSQPAFGYPWLFVDRYVLHRLPVPRHPPCALLSLTFRYAFLSYRLQSCSNHFWVLLVCKIIVVTLFFSLSLCFFFIQFSRFSPQVSLLHIYCIGLSTVTTELVGSNGLEPSTSRLSGVRSNHLSYEPISVAGSFPIGQTFWWRRTESNCRPPACKAGALPAELRPRIRFVPG